MAAGTARSRTAADRIRDAWSLCAPELIGRSGRHGAAVMLCLVKRDKKLLGDWEDYDVLFEVRSDKLHRQPGEICFPGGAIEPGEQPLTAAVREVTEELLIPAPQIRVLAPLSEMLTPAGDDLLCYGAELVGYEDTYSTDEVDHILRVPLGELMRMEPLSAQVEEVTVPGEDFPYDRIPGGRHYPWRGRKRTILFYRWPDGDGYAEIWGMTAALLRAFLERIKTLP